MENEWLILKEWDEKHWPSKEIVARRVKELNAGLLKASQKADAEAEALTGRAKSIRQWKAVELRSLMVPEILK